VCLCTFYCKPLSTCSSVHYSNICPFLHLDLQIVEAGDRAKGGWAGTYVLPATPRYQPSTPEIAQVSQRLSTAVPRGPACRLTSKAHLPSTKFYSRHTIRKRNIRCPVVQQPDATDHVVRAVSPSLPACDVSAPALPLPALLPPLLLPPPTSQPHLTPNAAFP